MRAYQHVPGGTCTSWQDYSHWHHRCWFCGADMCGFGQVDSYRCLACQVEERSNYAREPKDRDFDPTLALRTSCP